MGFFDISGDVIKQAEAAANFKLVIPKTAKKGKDGSDSWTEHGRVTEAYSETYEIDFEGRKTDVLVLSCKIEIDGEGSGENPGGTFRHQMRFNQAALSKGKGAPKGSQAQKQHTMSTISIHKLKMILRACGIEPDMEDGGYSQSLQSECFPAVDNFTGSASPLIGCSFWFEVKESPSEKNGRKFTNYEIAQVVDQ